MNTNQYKEDLLLTGHVNLGKIESIFITTANATIIHF